MYKISDIVLRLILLYNIVHDVLIIWSVPNVRFAGELHYVFVTKSIFEQFLTHWISDFILFLILLYHMVL